MFSEFSSKNENKNLMHQVKTSYKAPGLFCELARKTQTSNMSTTANEK